MLAVIGQLLPLALAVALSTVPITAVLTILLSPQSRAGLPYMLAFVIGNIIVTAAFSLGLRAVPVRAAVGAQVGLAVFEVILGAAIIAYAIVIFARRHLSTRSEEIPRWLRAVGKLRAWPAAGLGLLLTVRPKSLLLTAAAGVAIGPAQLSASEFVIAVLVFVILGTSTVTVPVILALARPTSARRPLRAAERWIAHNSRTVTVLVALVIGTVLVGNGLTRF
jgi:Sap, sulfolipid-1-addressing protein